MRSRASTSSNSTSSSVRPEPTYSTFRFPATLPHTIWTCRVPFARFRTRGAATQPAYGAAVVSPSGDHGPHHRRSGTRRLLKPGDVAQVGMTAPYIVDPARLLKDALAESSPDLMRNLLQTMINALLSEHADAVVGAEWGQRSPDRQAQRNGYRHREMDTRVGTIDV